MYIAARTTDGDILYWDGADWVEEAYEAMEYGTMGGHFKMGELEVDYVDDKRPAGPYDARISYIFEA